MWTAISGVIDMDEKKVESIIFGLKQTIAEKDKEIERLQGESADLNVKNATLEHENSELKQRVSILEADNDDYKNKIAENELVSIDWHYSQVEDLEEEKMRLGNRLSETQYSLSVCQDVNAEQKAEIEHLNSKYKNLEINYNSVWEDYRKYEVENAEQRAEIGRLIGDVAYWERKYCIAVKDTAKEILTKMLTNAKRLKEQFNSITYGKNREHLIATMEIEIEGIKNLAKRYGVEVEG